LRVPAIHRLVEVTQQLETDVSYSTQNASAVVGARTSRYKAFAFQTVNETCDSGRLFDHALADRQCRNTIRCGAAQDSQHVVLLRRNSVRFDKLTEAAHHCVRGLEQTENCLLLARPKILGLLRVGAHDQSLFPAATFGKQMKELALKRRQKAV
jgi:hypothetical protein